MAATTSASIGISTLRFHYLLPRSALPRATSPLQQPACCTLPRCRCGRLTHCSSCSPRVRGRAVPSLPPGGAPSSAFMAAQNASDGTTLQDRLIAPSSAAGTGNATTSPSGGLPSILGIAHLVVSLGIVLATDKFLKQAFVAASIKFPSALFGMFCVFSVLVVLDTLAPALAKGFMDFFEPATLFIQRWLPLFYVPSLVVLPLAVRDVPAASGLKICLITFGGWFASLTVAGYTALTVRKIVKTQLIAAEPMSKPSPFATLELWAWGAIFVASFCVSLVNPTALGTTARTCLPFLLASTVLGYMVGSGLPAGIKKVLHPIICCALSADLAAVAYGYLSGSGVDPVLGDYLTKAPSNPGAGDVLMGFLGSVIISFAFSMFKQRKLVKRHAAEIFTSIAISSTFSLYSTAILGRLVGLEPTLTISILPRCITVALALSIVSFFEGANTSLTAAVVVLTGLIGANFVQAAMDKLGLNDPIARGIGTASSAHGLGTAALSAKEPEALPFCAIAYALTGIFGSLICSSPAVRSFSCLPASLGFDAARTEAGRFLRAQGALDLTVPQLLRLASMSRAGPIRLGLDVGGGTGTLAARLKRAANATVVTTTMDLGAPYSATSAARGVGDGTMDMVRAGHAVNRWIPEAALEFLWYDADRVLRPGGLLWVDHFWCRKGDLDGVYAAMLRRLSYKTIKWAVADKPGNAKDEAVYLTALLQKPFSSNS